MAAVSPPHAVSSQRSAKKNAKKQSKKRFTVLKRNGIQPVDNPTHHMVIVNGGLDNNITMSELDRIFKSYGDIVDIVMQPQKSYAFISMAGTAEAVRARNEINGRLLKCPEEVSQQGVIFYLDYVQSVPGVSVPCNRLPEGLIVIEDFVNEEEEHILLEAIDWDQTDQFITEGSNLKHRRVKHYGYEFLYSTNNVDRERPLEHGIPAACHLAIDRLCVSGHMIKNRPDQLTVNQYQPGQGIPPHVDTHSAFEDGIVSLSLGSQCVMDFRHADGAHVSVLLPRRSVLIMEGEWRYLWTHGITPRKSDIVSQPRNEAADDSPRLTLLKRGTRTSFTFRKVRTSPCDCAYPRQCDSQKMAMEKSEGKKTFIDLPKSEDEARKIENEHVHEVYEEIASHFSDTRHSPWPRVAEFLRRQPEGALVVDIGCGNGKYLGVNKATFSVGCDRSFNLCQICAERGHQAFVADVLHLPLRTGQADVAISVAVIHHLSTHERRRRAVEEVVRVLAPGGQGLIYVWALEQEKDKVKSNYLKDTRIKRKDDLKTQEEQLLKMKGISLSEATPQVIPSSDTGEKEEFVGVTPDGAVGLGTVCFPSTARDGAVGLETANMCSNSPGPEAEKLDRKLSVHVNRTHFENQDLLVPWHSKKRAGEGGGKGGETDGERGGKSGESQGSVVHRFYHVFQQGELEALCQSLSNVHILESYYDKGNWCVIFQKL